MVERLKSEKYTVNKVYKEFYRDDAFLVNRKYQRKLVWTLEEKQFLVDTVFRQYPIPMFLLAAEWCSGDVKYEIIDGLQRLDAIVSFIEGDFPVKIGKDYGYFNLDALTGYGKRIENREIHQKQPTLPLELSERFLDYELSFSIIEKSVCSVEEVFRRINSTGRKLSKQDLRQAGVTGNFSDLVRKTSMYMRGDYTSRDIIDFSEVSGLSLAGKGLFYGIDVNDIFWIEKNIISEDALRRSKDEEIVAQIFVYLLLKGERSSSTSVLENAYETDSELKQRLDALLVGEDSIIHWMEIFSKTLGILSEVLAHESFTEKLFRKDKAYNKDYVFLVVFCAITNLFLDGMVLSSKDALSQKFDGLGDNELSEISQTSKVVWNRDVRNRLVNRVQCVLKPCFSYVPKESDNYDEWNVKMINFLESACAEEQMYDFKLGVTDFRSGEFNAGCVSKIVKTLTAMANTRPGEAGFVLLGVPNDAEDANTIALQLGVNPEYCRNYSVLGIRDEATTFYQGVDNYLRKLKDVIEQEPVSAFFKNEILTRSHLFEYRGKLLYLFVCQSSEPVYYGKRLFVRYGSHNHEVEVGSEEFNTVMKRFYSKDA